MYEIDQIIEMLDWEERRAKKKSEMIYWCSTGLI